MSADINTQPPPFSIWAILRRTFAVIRSDLFNFAVVAATFVALYHIPILLIDRSADDFSWWSFIVVRLAHYAIEGCAMAALIYGALLTLRGDKPSLRDLSRGLSFAFPVIAILFLTDLPAAVSVLLDVGNPEPAQITPVHVVLGVGSYILFVLWFAAAPAVIAEGRGVRSALGRSVALTKGNRWPIFGLVFVGGLVFEGVRLAAANVGGNAPVDSMSTSLLLITWIGIYVVPAVSNVFWAVSASIAYCALRLEKDGAGIWAST